MKTTDYIFANLSRISFERAENYFYFDAYVYNKRMVEEGGDSTVYIFDLFPVTKKRERERERGSLENFLVSIPCWATTAFKKR